MSRDNEDINKLLDLFDKAEQGDAEACITLWRYVIEERLLEDGDEEQ